MVIMGTSQSERQAGRTAQVPKLPSTSLNLQLSSRDVVVSTRKSSTPHLPRLLGSLPKSVTTADEVIIDTMLLSNQRDPSVNLTSEEGNTSLPPLDEQVSRAHDLPAGLPAWERDLSRQEIRYLSRRIPVPAAAPVVSEGYWLSMKLTPGEMDLKYNRNQNSPRRSTPGSRSKIQPKPTNQAKQKTKRAGSEKVSTDRMPTLTSSFSSDFTKSPYDKFSREMRQSHDGEDDPDRLNMGHIIHALQGQMSGSYREKDLSLKREERLDNGIKTAYPPTAVQMALKESRRYRRPSKSSGGISASVKHGSNFMVQPTKLSGIEKALKNSPSYETQQRNRRNKEATESEMRRYLAARSNASVSRSMSLYAQSLPLEAEPYSLHGLMKKRASSFHQQNQTDSGDDQDWRMNMNPSDWVKLLRANPGDPIFKRLGIEKDYGSSEQKFSNGTAIQVPTIDDTSSDRDSYVSDPPFIIRTPRTESADQVIVKQGKPEVSHGERSPPKTPVPFNSPETSPREDSDQSSIERQAGEHQTNELPEEEDLPTRSSDFQCSVFEHRHSSVDEKQSRDKKGVQKSDHIGNLEETDKREVEKQIQSESIKSSLSKKGIEGKKDNSKSNKRVVIVIPTKDATLDLNKK